MITRTGSARYEGMGKDGKGWVSTGSGVLHEQRYGFNTRFEDAPGTNPEELIAAAHAGCFTMALSFALAKEGINFSYTTDPNALNAENLARYDALLLYANHDSISPAQERALLDFVESGKGFLPIHSASHNFRNSSRVVAMMGGQFDRHGTGTFTVPIVQPNHPVTQGLTPFETWDETYVHDQHNEQGRTILEVRESEPYTWTRTEGKGRVFYTAWEIANRDERITPDPK